MVDTPLGLWLRSRRILGSLNRQLSPNLRLRMVWIGWRAKVFLLLTYVAKLTMLVTYMRMCPDSKCAWVGWGRMGGVGVGSSWVCSITSQLFIWNWTARNSLRKYADPSGKNETNKKKSRWTAPAPIPPGRGTPSASLHTSPQPTRSSPNKQSKDQLDRSSRSPIQKFNHNVVFRPRNPMFPRPFPHQHPQPYRMHLHGLPYGHPKSGFQLHNGSVPHRWNPSIQ